MNDTPVVDAVVAAMAANLTAGVGDDEDEEAVADVAVEEPLIRAVVRSFKYWVEGVGIITIGSVGLVINLFALYILFRKRVMRNFHLLMCSLAVFDLLHLVMDVACFSLPEFSTTYRDKFLVHGIPYFLPIAQISLTGSCYSTIAITIERFLAIRTPFFIQRHNLKARLFIVPVLVYAVLYNIPRFFEFKVVSVCRQPAVSSDGNGTASCADGVDFDGAFSLTVTEMRMNKAYISIYVNTMNLLFNMLLPFVTMGVMNYLIYRAMSRSYRARQSITGGSRRNASIVAGTLSAANLTGVANCRRLSAAIGQDQPSGRRRVSGLTRRASSFMRGRMSLHGMRSSDLRVETSTSGCEAGGGTTTTTTSAYDGGTTSSEAFSDGYASGSDRGANNVNGNEQREQRNLRRSCENVLRRREARITRVSIAITVMFLVCHMPRCIPNLMEMFMEPKNSPAWLPILVSINHLLIAINSAFNFLFYLSFCSGKKKNGRGTRACRFNPLNGTGGRGQGMADGAPRNGVRGSRCGADWDEFTETGMSTSSNNRLMLHTLVNPRASDRLNKAVGHGGSGNGNGRPTFSISTSTTSRRSSSAISGADTISTSGPSNPGSSSATGGPSASSSSVNRNLGPFLSPQAYSASRRRRTRQERKISRILRRYRERAAKQQMQQQTAATSAAANVPLLPQVRIVKDSDDDVVVVKEEEAPDENRIEESAL